MLSDSDKNYEKNKRSQGKGIENGGIAILDKGMCL